MARYVLVVCPGGWVRALTPRAQVYDRADPSRGSEAPTHKHLASPEDLAAGGEGEGFEGESDRPMFSRDYASARPPAPAPL